jgi:hypothetical protein
MVLSTNFYQLGNSKHPDLDLRALNGSARESNGASMHRAVLLNIARRGVAAFGDHRIFHRPAILADPQRVAGLGID